MENLLLDSALNDYAEIGEKYVNALEAKGLEFAPAHEGEQRVARLREELEAKGVETRNAGASMSAGWLSPACVECTGNGGSETFSTSFKCHRDCYFCFNHNLADYDRFVEEGCPWVEVMDEAYAANGGKLAVLGLTGGEPLLDIDATLAFLERAGEMFEGAHKRMYTSGDLLTPETARSLRDAGLDEIRFSIKQDDTDEMRERVLSNMEMAKEYIPHVMVEMPIVPGTEESMQEWMRRFSAAGIDGMNLLEFCFPFHSWEEFAKRGFKLKNPPFDVMYDYSYSGGLAVAGSEELALSLMLWAIEEDLGFGMHYCSLDNKHRSEMRQKNEIGRGMHPVFSFDEGDFFLKCAKAFGADADIAARVLKEKGCMDVLQDEQSIAFPVEHADALKACGVDVAVSFNVLEKDDQGRFFREIGLVRA